MVFAMNFILFSCLILTAVTSSPQSMSLGLLWSAIFLSLASILLSKWLFSIILLFYLGGMLILFFYLLSLITMTKLKDPSKKMIIGIILGSMTCFMVNMFTHYPMSISVGLIYSRSMIPGLMFMGIFLILLLILVVKMTSSWSGPLKSELE